MKEKDLILKVAERLEMNSIHNYNDIAEIVLTYSEGWKYEGEEMIELIDKILSLKDDIIKSLNSTEKDLPF
mgnify:CR=1 FL=1|jgi:hypothetical protein|tara:strand:- start:144 stop:356 length:213 start_codon:yes stop_codon:yes gene_type:complete